MAGIQGLRYIFSLESKFFKFKIDTGCGMTEWGKKHGQFANREKVMDTPSHAEIYSV